VVQYFRGADPLNIVEDFAEDAWDRGLAGGALTGDELIGYLRQTEDATGQRYLADDYADDDGNRLPLLEALSKASTEYTLGNAKAEALPARFRQWLEMITAVTANAFRHAQTLARSQHLMAAIQEGKIDPEFERLIADSVGLNEEASARRIQQASEHTIRDTESTPKWPSQGGSIEITPSFSISRARAIEIRKEIEAQTPPVTTISGIPDLPKAKQALEWMEENGIFGETSHPEINGPIQVSRKGGKHTIGHRLSKKKAAVMLVLKDLIPVSTLMETTAPSSQLKSHRLAGKVEIDGIPHIARIVIDQDANGRRYYNHELSDFKALQELEKERPRPLQSGVSSVEQQLGGQEFGDTGKLLRWIYSVNDPSDVDAPSPADESLPEHESSSDDTIHERLSKTRKREGEDGDDHEKSMAEAIHARIDRKAAEPKLQAQTGKGVLRDRQLHARDLTLTPEERLILESPFEILPVYTADGPEGSPLGNEGGFHIAGQSAGGSDPVSQPPRRTRTE
jgi:hypothetical protein